MHQFKKAKANITKLETHPAKKWELDFVQITRLKQ